MVFICSAAYCKSNQKTLINGEKVHFFSFPVDQKLRSEWEKACNPIHVDLKKTGLNPRVICHLHFHKNSFESINKLKPDAVPMIPTRKRKIDDNKLELQPNDIKTKRPLVSLSAVDNIEPKMNSKDNNIQSNSFNELVLQPYRLFIQIEKVLQRPCPKSKKNNQSKTNGTIGNGLMNNSSKDQNTLVKKENQYLCLVCKEKFETTSKLHMHLKEHFTCDICRLEFSSQKSYKTHYEMHQSKNERYPYKCHVCNALFEKKDYIKTHNHIKNMGKFESADENRIQYCKSCHLTFRDEPTFRKHLNSHVELAVSSLNDPLSCND